MFTITDRLSLDHRILEKLLDDLAGALSSARDLAERMARAADAAAGHYRSEQYLLERLGTYEPGLSLQMLAQHSEALEIAARFSETVFERDRLLLARRFHAVAQHNIVQEERDVFPLVERCLTEEETRSVLRRLEESG